MPSQVREKLGQSHPRLPFLLILFFFAFHSLPAKKGMTCIFKKYFEKSGHKK